MTPEDNSLVGGLHHGLKGHTVGVLRGKVGIDRLRVDDRDEALFQDSHQYEPITVPFQRRRQEAKIPQGPTDRNDVIETRLIDGRVCQGFPREWQVAYHGSKEA